MLSAGAASPGSKSKSEQSSAHVSGSAAPGNAPKELELLNVSYDPTRELWRDINEHFIATYEKESGHQAHDQAVARRLEHAGARRHRRARGRRRHARLVHRHRRDQQEGPDQAGLGRPAAEPLAALLLDDRLRRPQGQSQGHQGLARSGEAGRRDHHAEPEDLGQRLPRASSAPGARSSCAAARGEDAIELRDEALQAGPGARFGRARRDHDLRPEEDRRRAPRLGERGAPRGARGEGRAGAGLPADQHPRRAARGGGRRQRRPQEDPRRPPRRT